MAEEKLIGNAGKGVQILAAAPPVVVGAPVGTDVPSTQLPAQGRTILELNAGNAPQVVSCSLYTNDLPNAAPGVPRLARARVEYGNSGSLTEFLMDWMRGTTFTIPTQTLRVSVVADPIFPVFQGFFGAIAAYGGLAANYKQPQLTQGPGEASAGALPLNPGQTMDFNVPVLAESARILTFPDEPFSVQGREPVVGLLRYVLEYGNPGLNPPADVPISNDVAALRITNLGANPIDSIRVIWKLAI